MTSGSTTSLPVFLSSNVSALVSYMNKEGPVGRPPPPPAGTSPQSSSLWRDSLSAGSGDDLFRSPHPFVYNISESLQLTDIASHRVPPSSIFPTRDSQYYDSYDNKSTDWVVVLTTTTNTTAGSQTESDALSWVRDIALGVVLFSLCLLTFVGNAMVLHAVRTERRLQSVSNMFIVSLAIADLIVGLIVMPISSIYIFTDDWLFGVGVCQFWIGVDYTASTASILNLLILSLDRYWSVTAPLRYLRKRTKRRAAIMISLVWSVSCLWLIPIIGWHHFEHGGVRTVTDDVCDTEYATNTALKIITGILNYYLPLAVMYGLYTKIFMEIRKRSKMEIGQRINCSGAREPSLGPTTSLSEDSDERNRQHSRDMRTTSLTVDSSLHNGRLKSCYKPDFDDSPLNQRINEGETGTCTETEDEDLARLHKSGYTNLTLVRVASNASQRASRTYANSSDVMSSDSECRMHHYVYDESVVDPTTEKIQHFLYEEHAIPLIRCNSQYSHKEAGKLEETSLNNSTPDTPVYSEKDVRFQVSDSQGRAEETLTKFPKEPHPAKNKYVKPRTTRLTEKADTGSDTCTTDAGIDSNSTVCLSRRDTLPPLCRTPSPQPPSRCASFRQRSRSNQSTSSSVKRQISRLSSNASSSSNQTGSTTRFGKLLSQNNNGENNHNNHHPHHNHPQHHHKQHHHHGKSALIKQAVRWKKKLDKKKHTPSMALHKEIKAARQLGVIMGAFTVCFFPYFVCFMVVAFCEDCVSPDLMTVVTWFGYLNSTLNPFLYPLCNSHFRRKFRKMLRLKVTDDKQRRSSKYYAMSSHHRHINSSYDPS